MGACFECLVEIDGQPNRQACMTRVAPGMQIATQRGAPRVACGGAMTIDVAVVGAGPAGLAAATRCARLGLATTLFDEQPAPGGQIYRGITDAPAVRVARLGAEYARGDRARRRISRDDGGVRAARVGVVGARAARCDDRARRIDAGRGTAPRGRHTWFARAQRSSRRVRRSGRSRFPAGRCPA